MSHAESIGGADGAAVSRRGQESGGLFSSERLATLGPLIALLLVCVFFTTQSDRFLSGQNFSLIFQQVMVIGTLAIGQTLIILTAGIDLACGAIMALGGIVMTKLAVTGGVPPFLALLLGILACGAFGLLHGVLVTRVDLPPFIVTLGTLNIAFALTHIYSKDETISDLPASSRRWGTRSSRLHVRHLRLAAVPGVVRPRLVRAIADDLGPAHLRHRRQARGDAPDGINVKRQLT